MSETRGYAEEIHPVDLIEPYTLTPRSRRLALAGALAKIDADRIPGDIVECGVWRGGNIILSRLLSPDRVCWLYDTFTGMTKPRAEDKHRSGRPAMDKYRLMKDMGQPWVAASKEDVEQVLTATDTYSDTLCRFVVGDVEKTLTQLCNLPSQIALLRLDTDWYASTKLELEVLYPRLMPGGVLIVDDYGHWQGARQAVNEYFGDRGPQFTFIDYSAILMIKP